MYKCMYVLCLGPWVCGNTYTVEAQKECAVCTRVHVCAGQLASLYRACPPVMAAGGSRTALSPGSMLRLRRVNVACPLPRLRHLLFLCLAFASPFLQ